MLASRVCKKWPSRAWKVWWLSLWWLERHRKEEKDKRLTDSLTRLSNFECQLWILQVPDIQFSFHSLFLAFIHWIHLGTQTDSSKWCCCYEATTWTQIEWFIELSLTFSTKASGAKTLAANLVFLKVFFWSRLVSL